MLSMSSLGFALLFIVCIADICIFAFDEYAWSAFLLLAMFGIAYGLTSMKTFILSIGWKVILLKYLPVYLLLGIVTAVIKWIAASIGWGNKIAEFREVFARDWKGVFHGMKITEPEDSPKYREMYLMEFVNYCRGRVPEYLKIRNEESTIKDPNYLLDALTPRAKHNVEIISVWITQWPLVVLTTLFKNIFVDLARHVATFFDRTLSYLGRKLVAKATRGM